MLQFTKQVKVLSKDLAVGAWRPNAQPAWCDYLGEAFSTRSFQTSVDRGFFYVFADKLGTLRTAGNKICVDGDYFPVWVGGRKKYKVARKWAQNLWEARKLSHDMRQQGIK